MSGGRSCDDARIVCIYRQVQIVLAFSVVGGFYAQNVVVAFRDNCRLDEELRRERAGPYVVRAQLLHKY